MRPPAFRIPIIIGGSGAASKRSPRPGNVRTEMALSVLAYNLTRVMNMLGPGPLIQAMRA